MARYVPGQWIVVRQAVPGGAFTQRKWQPGHWADERGNWVPKPSRPVSVTVRSGSTSGSGVGSGWTGLSDDEIQRRASALADADIAAKSAEINRQRAAAQAQAQADAQMYQGLGQAQMQMIGQIPANIQAIRDTAGQAIASFGGQVTDAQKSQALAEQAANAQFTASQTGGTAQAAPDAGGVNAAGAAAAEQAMGGTIPATAQAEVGAASAIAASGMPAVVARATQDQIAMRMSQAASEDADYRQQLIDLAATRGGIYQDAYNNLYDIEAKKFGVWEAQQRLELDQKQFALQVRTEKANERALGLKSATAADKSAQAWARIKLANQKQAASLKAAIAKGAQPNASLSRAYGHIVDSNGNTIPDENGNEIPVAKTGAGAKPPKGGVAKANSMARQFRGTPFTTTTNAITGAKKTKRNRPKVSYDSAYQQIVAALVDDGYSPAQAQQIARSAVNSAYGPGVGGRPGELQGPGFVGGG